MKIWLDKEPNWNNGYIWSENPIDAFGLIEQRKGGDDACTHISIPANVYGTRLLQLLDGKYKNMFHVDVRGDLTPEIRMLIYKNNWHKQPFSKRTAEIIMILKGNHDLDECPEVRQLSDNQKLGVYLDDIALYLSDDCGVPYQTYLKDASIINAAIKQAVLEYISACDNPQSFLARYFEAQRVCGERYYNETQCWCSALMHQAVRDDNGNYINGFTPTNIMKYERQRPFVL